MQLPTIHSNGTSKASLINDLCDASNTLEEAYQTLKRCAPNGRDYYLQGAVAMETAEREHISRLKRLDEVKQEVDALTVAIDQLGD